MIVSQSMLIKSVSESQQYQAELERRFVYIFRRGRAVLVGWLCDAGQRFFACVVYTSKIVGLPLLVELGLHLLWTYSTA